MSDKKYFSKIKEEEKVSKGVVSLAIRPNMPSTYGEGSLSGKQLQQRFDQLARLVIDKYNEMADALSGTSVLEYLSLPASITATTLNTLEDLLQKIVDGDGDLAVVSSDAVSSAKVKTLIENLRTSINDLDEYVKSPEYREQLKGDKGNPGDKGDPGDPGRDGKSVVGASINEAGQLLLTFSDNTVVNAGRVVGAAGKDGTSVNIIGSFDSIDELPTFGDVKGDAYLVDGRLYIWDGTKWADGGNIQGDPGKDGDTITTASLNTEGQLVLTLSGGTVLTVGKVVGRDGVDGVNGKSAFELYKEVHPSYTGSLEQWLDELNGYTKNIRTTSGALLRVFVGSQAEYDNLQDKSNVFALITDDPDRDSFDRILAATFTQGLEYTLSPDGNSYVCSGKGTFSVDDGDLAEVTIPSEYLGLPVVGIGDSAFAACNWLSSIIIPNSVKSIGNMAFGDCSFLTNVKMGNRVTSISENAFYSCYNLKEMRLPNSLTSIGGWAFFACNELRMINIPLAVTTIGSYAFQGCDKLHIYCESEVMQDGWETFWNPSAAVSWGTYAPDVLTSDRATRATYAEYSDTAGSAQTANSAKSADEAETAKKADEAETAKKADKATSLELNWLVSMNASQINSSVIDVTLITGHAYLIAAEYKYPQDTNSSIDTMVLYMGVGGNRVYSTVSYKGAGCYYSGGKLYFMKPETAENMNPYSIYIRKI